MSLRDLSVEAMAAERLLVTYRAQLGDDVEAAADLVEGQTGFMEAVDTVVARIALLEDHIEALIAHGRKLNDRNSRYKAQHEALRKALLSALELTNMRSIERPTATISQRRGAQQVVIINDAEIPADYLIPQPPKVNTKAIKEALQNGPVPGAELSNGPTSLNLTRS